MASSKTVTQTQQETKPRKPVQEFRLGRIRAAVWEHPTDSGNIYNVTFSRSYKDAKDEWKSSDSFGRDDLLLVAEVSRQASLWIFQKQQERD